MFLKALTIELIAIHLHFNHYANFIWLTGAEGQGKKEISFFPIFCLEFETAFAPFFQP